MAILVALSVEDVDSTIRSLWLRVAFMTRCGRATLTEALCELETDDAIMYCDAILTLIKQENEAKRREP
jgi:hypothetical protein